MRAVNELFIHFLCPRGDVIADIYKETGIKEDNVIFFYLLGIRRVDTVTVLVCRFVAVCNSHNSLNKSWGLHELWFSFWIDLTE